MNNLDLLRPIAVFVEVVDQGSFKGAAERLALSPPYVSQLISDLEARLGRQLLFRSTRKIEMTDAGVEFLDHARKMSDAFSAALQSQTALSGRLRVTAPTVFAMPTFARIMSKFLEQHPDVSLEMILDDTAIDPVAARVDLSLRISDPGDDPRLARKLFETYGVVCCAPKIASKIHDIRDLTDLLWLRTPTTPHSLSLIDTKGKVCKVTPKHQMTVNSAEMIVALLKETSGFAVFPEFATVDTIDTGELVNPLPGCKTSVVPAYALYTERRTELSNARAFVNCLIDGLKHQAPHSLR